MGNQKEARDRLVTPRVLTSAEFYLAMQENPDPSGLGLRPENRSFFVGQERAYRQLSDALTQSPNGTVVLISAPLGAGKDALLDVVVSDLRTQGSLKEHEVQVTRIDHFKEDQKFEDIDRHLLWANEPEGWPNVHPKVLIINEVSYMWYSAEKHKEYLTRAGKFLGKEAPIIVLLGDALENRELIDALGSPHEPIYIPLDPLTPDMLKGTLRQRLARALERSPEEIDIDGMFDPEVFPPLAPNAEYPIANMRMTLSVIESLRRDLKPTKEPFKITGNVIRKHSTEEWARNFWGEGFHWKYPVGMQQFRLWLIKYVNSHSNGRNLMHAVTLDEIMQACPLGLSADEYRKEIVNSLYRIGVLKRVGASQDRYLPSQAVFLEAAFIELPFDPESDEGQKEIKRVKEIFYVLAHRYGVGGLNDEEYEDRKNKLILNVQSLYGWEPEFSLALIEEAEIRVREEEKEREKQRLEREKKYKEEEEKRKGKQS